MFYRKTQYERMRRRFKFFFRFIFEHRNYDAVEKKNVL